MDMQLSNPIISQSLTARSAIAPGTESQNGKLPDGAPDDAASINFAKFLAQAMPPVNGLTKPAAIKVPGAKDQNPENEADPVAGGNATINLSSPMSSALPAIAGSSDQKTIRPNARSTLDADNTGMDVSGPILANFMPTQQPAGGSAFDNLSAPTSSALAATASAGDQNTIHPNTRPAPEANKPGMDVSGPVLANFMPAPQAAGMKMKSESESIRLSASQAIAQQPLSSAASTPDTAVQPSTGEVQAAPARPAFVLPAGHDVATDAMATPEKQTIQATDFSAMPADRIALTLPATAQISTATPVQQLEIPIPIGNHDWNNQLGQRVIWMSSQQKQIAEIRINPPELGPIELRLTVYNQQSAQNATLHFVSPHAEVRNAIENSMPQLRVLMADAGITLGNATVSGESLPRQQTPGQEAAAGNNSFALSSGKPGAIETTSASPSLSRGNALLDTFA